MPSLRLCGFVVFTVLSMVALGCDGSDDTSDITINVEIQGTGSGRVQGRTLGLDIECNVNEGAVTGTCSTSLQESGAGTLRIEATPDAVTNFSWGGDCIGTTTRVCELSFGTGEDVVFDVVGRFAAKTASIVVSPKPITMTVAGPQGEVVAQAQALDEDGAEVFGVSFVWTNDAPDVVTVTPLPANRQATIVALKSGSAIVSATTQGVTGQTQVYVSLSN